MAEVGDKGDQSSQVIDKRLFPMPIDDSRIAKAGEEDAVASLERMREREEREINSKHLKMYDNKEEMRLSLKIIYLLISQT